MPNKNEIKTDYDIKKIYEQIELELIASMKRNLGSHNAEETLENFDWPQWQALKLKQLRRLREDNKDLFKEQQKQIDRYVYKAIKQQFKEGMLRVNKDAINAGFLKKEDSKLGGSFFVINDRKVKALANTVQDDLKDVQMATLRMSRDIYRSTIYKASQMASSGAKTLNQAIDMASKDFLKRGFNCIEYKDGRRINIADYADMAVRTATKRANLMGEGEFRKQLGNTFVYVSKHGTSCDKCSKWGGRVYIDDIWSGGTKKDGKYPLLSTAVAGGLFHPRCRHGLSTYFEGVNDEPEELQENEYNQNDAYIQELQRRQKEYERLATGSLFLDNVKNYTNKANDLQNKIENDTILLENRQKIIRRYNNWNGENLKLLAEDLVDDSEIPVYQRMLKGNHAECPFNLDENHRMTITSMRLSQTDNRDKKYKVKTILHELFHARSNKLLTDIKEIGIDGWREIEEIFAECSAHYHAKLLGISDLGPSYVNYLAYGLPRLKRLEEFKNCNNIYDFGKIATKYRFGKRRTAKWKDIYERIKNIDINYNEYASNYMDFVVKNKENIILKYLETQNPEFIKYKDSMIKDLEDAIQRVQNNEELIDYNQRNIFNQALLCAMNRKGVL